MIASILAWFRPVADRFPRLAFVYRTVRDQMAQLEAPVRTEWGFVLAGNPIMATGAFEREETLLVRRLLADVDVLINIGANIGYYCCHALSLGKTVIAFEPMPANVRYLCRNVDANGWSCEIFPLALSNAIGVLKLYGAGSGASLVKGWAGTPDTYYTMVPCSTLDTVLGSRLCGKKVLVVIDVEGAEQWVLEGSSQLLANDPKPLWLIEITSSQHQPQDVGMNPRRADTFNVMFAAGYDAVTADTLMRPVTPAEVAEAQQTGRDDWGVHNFLFRPAVDSDTTSGS